MVVKAIEEDGLAEEDGESVEEKIVEMFAELDEKPKVTACRIGMRSTGTTSVCVDPE